MSHNQARSKKQSDLKKDKGTSKCQSIHKVRRSREEKASAGKYLSRELILSEEKKDAIWQSF